MHLKEKEIHDESFFREFFRKAQVLTLSLNDGEYPYAVPMNFVEHEGALYMHSALVGHKMDCIANDPHVHFSLYENLGVDRKAATMHFESVCGTGIAELLSDKDQKRSVLAALAGKYESECPIPIPDRMLAVTAVIKVNITSLCGKSSRKEG